MGTDVSTEQTKRPKIPASTMNAYKKGVSAGMSSTLVDDEAQSDYQSLIGDVEPSYHHHGYDECGSRRLQCGDPIKGTDGPVYDECYDKALSVKSDDIEYQKPKIEPASGDVADGKHPPKGPDAFRRGSGISATDRRARIYTG